MQNDLLCPYPLVALEESNLLAFGGSQNWFCSHTARYSGCGPVAAAGLLAQLALTQPKAAKALGLPLPQNGIFAKQPYQSHQQQVYSAMGSHAVPLLSTWADKRLNTAAMTVKPASALRAKSQRAQKALLAKLPLAFGHTAASFRRGLLRYAGQKGLALNAHCLRPTFTPYEKGLSFIRQGLCAGVPVVLRCQFNVFDVQLCPAGFESVSQHLQNRRPHFITVVGLRQTTKQTLLLASNWGQQAIIPYAGLHKSWQSPLALGSALLYFTLNEIQ